MSNIHIDVTLRYTAETTGLPRRSIRKLEDAIADATARDISTLGESTTGTLSRWVEAHVEEDDD